MVDNKLFADKNHLMNPCLNYLVHKEDQDFKN